MTRYLFFTVFPTLVRSLPAGGVTYGRFLFLYRLRKMLIHLKLRRENVFIISFTAGTHLMCLAP